MEYSNSRNPNHDYSSKSIYLLTLSKSEGIMDFSCCVNDLGRRNAYPGVIASRVGEAIKKGFRQIPVNFPFARLISYIIMPDHIHFILEYRQQADTLLGEIVAKFKIEVGNELGFRGVFTPGFHDRILRTKGQLSRMVNYVKENPQRRILKQLHSEHFSTRHIVELWGKQYVIYGNFLLLRNPLISQVRVSRSYAQEKLQLLNSAWEEIIRANGVLVSPFIAKEEKAIMEKGIEGGASIILISRDEIGERFKPSGRLFYLCARGRLLIISTQKGYWNEKLSRKESLEMNSLAEKLEKEDLPSLVLKPFPSSKSGLKRPLCGDNASDKALQAKAFANNETCGNEPTVSAVPAGFVNGKSLGLQVPNSVGPRSSEQPAGFVNGKSLGSQTPQSLGPISEPSAGFVNGKSLGSQPSELPAGFVNGKSLGSQPSNSLGPRPSEQPAGFVNGKSLGSQAPNSFGPRPSEQPAGFVNGKSLGSHAPKSFGPRSSELPAGFVNGKSLGSQAPNSLGQRPSDNY